jgi:hypothetical protein
MIVLPFFAMAGLLLLLFCWRDLLIWGWPVLLLSTIIGASPLLYYNLKQTNGTDSVSILLKLFHGTDTQAPHTLHEIVHAVKATVLVSIPTATGNPFCPVYELPWLSDNAPHTLACSIEHTAWGGSYVMLLAVALVWAVSLLWRSRFSSSAEASTSERQRIAVGHMARLMLLGSGILLLAGYTLSSGPMSWPSFHARYLIGLLIITPAIVAPLWSAASTAGPQMVRLERAKMIAARATLIIAGSLLLIGTFIAFSEVPAAQSANQQRANLIRDLLRIGATHVYSDYWTCDALAFTSNERIVCAVINGSFQPSHNRDPRYYNLVSADPHAAYVYPEDYQIPEILRKIAQASPPYQRHDFDGYKVYQPASGRGSQ